MSGYGFICVSDVPRELFKKYNNGKIYLNIKIVRRKEVGKYGETHFVTCEPPQEERKEGVNYICGNIKEWVAPKEPTFEDIESAPAASKNDIDSIF